MRKVNEPTLSLLGRLKRAAQAVLHGVGYQFQRYPGLYSYDRHLRMLLATLAVNCIIDVGAHDGEFYRAMRNTGYTGRIVSFEPFPRSFTNLQRETAGDPEWRGYQVALGRQAGSLELNVPDSTGFASFLKPNDYLGARFPWARWEGRTERVRVDRLDNIYSEIVAGIDKPRVFLKMDTQGWDGNVVEGASDALPDVQLLQSEISVVPIYHGMLDIVDSLSLYTRLGFQVTSLFPVTFDADDVRVLEYDCVMFRSPKDAGSTT